MKTEARERIYDRSRVRHLPEWEKRQLLLAALNEGVEPLVPRDLLYESVETHPWSTPGRA